MVKTVHYFILTLMSRRVSKNLELFSNYFTPSAMYTELSLF